MQKFLSDAVEFFPILLQGVWLTIVVTIGSLALSTVLGLFWALMRVSGIGVLAGLSADAIYHVPSRYMHERRAAEVLVLPAAGGGEALIVPPREFVRELK